MTLTKEYILAEIRRTAMGNGGKALGRQRFEKETGIKESDWFGKYWARWNDALTEAGLGANRFFNEALSEEFLLERLASITQGLGRFPVTGDLRMWARTNPGSPNDKTFARLGTAAERRAKMIEFCKNRPEYEAVLALVPAAPQPSSEAAVENVEMGFVYLFKSGRHYKIGEE